MEVLLMCVECLEQFIEREQATRPSMSLNPGVNAGAIDVSIRACRHDVSENSNRELSL